MKKGFMIGLSIVLLSLLLLMIQDSRDMRGDFQLKGNSFIERIQIVQKKDGETLWTLHAAKADFFEGEDKAELSDMSLHMKKNNIVLYTDKGIYSLSEKRFTTDQVVKARAEDFLITADSIDFDISKGTIETGGRVELESENIKIEGKGLKKTDRKTITIYDDVKATFYQ